MYLQSWVESFEVANDRELVIHHRDAFTHSNLLALTTFPVRPAHYYAGRDPGKVTMEPPLVSGPYRVHEFDRNHVTYKRVDDYWGRDLPVNRGRHNFETIRYDVYRDATVAREAFRKGLLDIFFETDVRYWNTAYDTSAPNAGRLRKGTRRVGKSIGQEANADIQPRARGVPRCTGPRGADLCLGFRMAEPRVPLRLAESGLELLRGSSLAAVGLPSEEETALLAPYRDQLPERVFTEAFRLPVSVARGPNRTGLERARRLLADAGWTLVDGRLQDADGKPFSLEIAMQNAWAKRLLLPYVDALASLGIDARLRLLDNVTAVRFKRERRFDMYFRGLDFLNPPMGQLITYFGSGERGRGSWRQSGRYS